MTVASYGSTSARPRVANDFVYADTGATLDSSNLIQVNWDKSTFDLSTSEGKERMFATLMNLVDQFQSAVMRSGTTPASFK